MPWILGTDSVSINLIYFCLNSYFQAISFKYWIRLYLPNILRKEKKKIVPFISTDSYFLVFSINDEKSALKEVRS